MTLLHDIRFHREVLRQAELVEQVGGVLVARVDALPEFAVVLAGEGRRVLLRLVLEDRLDLEPQLFLRHRYEPRGLGDAPLLPRATCKSIEIYCKYTYADGKSTKKYCKSTDIYCNSAEIYFKPTELCSMSAEIYCKSLVNQKIYIVSQ